MVDAMLKKAILGPMFTIILLIVFIPYTLAHDLPSYNLSDYITPYDNEVIKLAETIGLKPFLSYPLDNTGNAYYWVSENIRYMHDEQRWGARDYWQLPSTTLKLGTGDCEDQAILLTSLLRALKLPRENVRLVIGPTERGTYHAWVEIKIPLPIYGLETVATHALELLENKKVAISIGEVSYNQSITSVTIAEMKTKGLSQRDGWIPLDTTAKLFGLPVPFSWWLTYGYNIYTFLGCQVTPELTFQDKARIWKDERNIETGASISFEIPCIRSDRILGVVKARNAWRERTLVSAGGFDRLAGYDGPFYIRAGEKLQVEWTADRQISVYILNEMDFVRWREYYSWTRGGPTSYRFHKNADKGTFEYTVQNSDNYYVVIYVLHTILGGYPARIYSWTVKHIWQETSCNIQVSVSDPQEKLVVSVSIAQREVEKRFGFTAEENGIYKVVLRNVGESAPIYVRLEEFSTPLSPEVAGISENLALAEQGYVDKIAKIVKETETNTTPNGNLNLTDIAVIAAALLIIALSVCMMLKMVKGSTKTKNITCASTPTLTSHAQSAHLEINERHNSGIVVSERYFCATSSMNCSSSTIGSFML
jgi:hypothetical protein